MNLMFWKKRASEEAVQESSTMGAEPQDSLDFVAMKPAVAASEEPGVEASGREGCAEAADEATDPPMPKPGLVKRLQAGFVAFFREFKAPAIPVVGEEEGGGSRGRSRAASCGEPDEETSGIKPVRARKRFVVVGSVALLVLSLGGIGMARWSAFESPEKRWGTRHDISDRPVWQDSLSPQSLREEHRVEVLRRENAELQAQIEALKKERPPHAPLPIARDAASSSVGSEMAVSNSDPKSAAMSLKEAIETMNARTGDYGYKPAK